MALSQADPAYFEDASGIIRADPALSSQVIKIANSALYAGRTRAETLDEAVLRVGIRMVVASLSAEHLKRSFDPRKSGLKGIWVDSALSAIVCRWIAADREWPGIVPEAAYTHGLLHDLGRLVLYSLFQRFYEEEPPGDLCPVTQLPMWEHERLGATHALAGRLLANQWRFPNDVTLVIGAHHFPMEHRTSMDDHVNLFVDLVGLADLLVHHASDPEYGVRLDIARILLKRLDLPADRAVAAITEAMPEADRQLAALGLSREPEEAPIVLA